MKVTNGPEHRIRGLLTRNSKSTTHSKPANPIPIIPPSIFSSQTDAPTEAKFQRGGVCTERDEEVPSCLSQARSRPSMMNLASKILGDETTQKASAKTKSLFSRVPHATRSSKAKAEATAATKPLDSVPVKGKSPAKSKNPVVTLFGKGVTSVSASTTPKIKASRNWGTSPTVHLPALEEPTELEAIDGPEGEPSLNTAHSLSDFDLAQHSLENHNDFTGVTVCDVDGTNVREASHAISLPLVTLAFKAVPFAEAPEVQSAADPEVGQGIVASFEIPALACSSTVGEAASSDNATISLTHVTAGLISDNVICEDHGNSSGIRIRVTKQVTTVVTDFAPVSPVTKQVSWVETLPADLEPQVAHPESASTVEGSFLEESTTGELGARVFVEHVGDIDGQELLPFIVFVMKILIVCSDYVPELPMATPNEEFIEAEDWDEINSPSFEEVYAGDFPTSDSRDDNVRESLECNGPGLPVINIREIALTDNDQGQRSTSLAAKDFLSTISPLQIGAFGSLPLLDLRIVHQFIRRRVLRSRGRKLRCNNPTPVVPLETLDPELVCLDNSVGSTSITLVDMSSQETCIKDSRVSYLSETVSEGLAVVREGSSSILPGGSTKSGDYLNASTDSTPSIYPQKTFAVDQEIAHEDNPSSNTGSGAFESTPQSSGFIGHEQPYDYGRSPTGPTSAGIGSKSGRRRSGGMRPVQSSVVAGKRLIRYRGVYVDPDTIPRRQAERSRNTYAPRSSSAFVSSPPVVDLTASDSTTTARQGIRPLVLPGRQVSMILSSSDESSVSESTLGMALTTARRLTRFAGL